MKPNAFMPNSPTLQQRSSARWAGAGVFVCLCSSRRLGRKSRAVIGLPPERTGTAGTRHVPGPGQLELDLTENTENLGSSREVTNTVNDRNVTGSDSGVKN